MIDGLKPYPAYKDSGVPWLGEVPSHWTTPRLKAVFREVDCRSGTGEEPLLSLRMRRGLVDHHATGGKPIPSSSLVHYKRTQPGEIVMNRMRAAAGLFAVTRTVGLVSPDYAVLRPHTQVDLQYFVHLFRTPNMMSIFRVESRGLGTGESGFLRLYAERFGMLAAPFPPIDEQAAIVRFLAHADRLIGRYIRTKEKLISLLNEQKQAIIHSAVTRGLDSNVRLKPSGVDWLGAVPAHWEVWRVGHFGRVGNGSTPARGNPGFWMGGTYPWLNSSSVNRSPIRQADQFVTDLALRDCHLPRVPPGSVLVAITGQGKTRGTSAVLAIEATINQHIAYITPVRQAVTPEYLHAALVGAYRKLRAISDDSGSTKGALTCWEISHFKVALTERAEQLRVVSALGAETACLDAAIAKNERQLDLVHEYRARLITGIVTGEFDVRDAASKLPDEVDKAEPLAAGPPEAAEEEADAEAAAEEAGA